MEKYQHMRSFISAALEYSKHSSETTSSVLQRNLGVLSVSLDLSIFDPGTSIAAEFYVSLHELMNSLGSRTTLIWSAVDVLQNICRNATARHALIHTYKFAPILARLLEANLTSEKRMRVLKLLQELTYGIKISWQEAHLPYLISILTQWVTQSKEEDIIALSLGVLVNLCYKNLSAVYTLVRVIDTKAFIRTLLRIQSLNVNTRVQCCKLLIILEHTSTNIPEKYILDFANVTFNSLIAALKAKDVLILRHIIDFFDDVGENEHLRTVLLTYTDYGKNVENILGTLEGNSDPECVALMMECLLSLVKLRLSSLVPLYPAFVKSAMMWVPVEEVCSKALALIRMVVIDSRRTKISTEVLAELDPSVLMLITNTEDEESRGKTEHSSDEQLRLAELMQLFQEMVKVSGLREKVMHSFNEQAMRRLLKPMLEHESSSRGDWAGSLTQNPTTNLYMHALALTADLAAHNSNWLTFYSDLLRKKQIQMTMALALFTGDGDVKQKVLQLTSTVGFPQECVSAVAACMRQLEPLVLVQSTTSSTTGIRGKFNGNYPGIEMAPFISFPQEERLNTLMVNLQRAFETNQIGDITTSAVMELYEYKLAAMQHAERAMQSSLEAANNHATSLQHRLAQVIAESSRLHQLLFDTQQCLEGMKSEHSTLMRKLGDAEEQCRKTHTLKNQEIEGLKKIVAEKSASIEHLSERAKELETNIHKVNVLTEKVKEWEIENAHMNTKNHELNKLLHKMQDNLNKKDEILKLKTAEIESNRKDISALKQETQQLTETLHSYEQAIVQKEEVIQKTRSELTDLSRMRDIIFDLAAKTRDDLNTS